MFLPNVARLTSTCTASEKNENPAKKESYALKRILECEDERTFVKDCLKKLWKWSFAQVPFWYHNFEANEVANIFGKAAVSHPILVCVLNKYDI